MIPIWIVLAFALVGSLFGNLALFLNLKRAKNRKTESVELRDFLMDLKTGWSLLAISRLDPNDMLLRSPRQQ